MSDSSEIRTSDSDDEFIMDMLYHLPRPRLFRGRSNPLEEFDDFDFKCRFRLSKESFGVLMHLIVQDVKHETKRNVALSPEVQVLITLRYYVTGTFQLLVIISELINLLYVELLKEFQLLLLVFTLSL
ncbi:unnamed protein product [Macrosiphum euphorbiae]|uniref:Uncharacterized protein n=1 Tax=Macrosiphum euphorbiae TaxID=13131 RepID=A0AAV0XXM5_9HEMI|nr:unnamed protein product [Macrosiphum euphorbiae]